MTRPAPAHAAARVLRGSAILLAESGVRVAVTALLSLWIAHRVGAAGFGLLTLASALAALGTVLMAQGLDLPLVARLARKAQPAHAAAAGRWLGAALVLRLAAALAVLALLVLVALWLRPHDTASQAVIMVVALCVLAYAPGVADMAFRARAQAAPAAAARLAATLLAALAKVLALVLHASLVWLAWAIVLEAVLASAFLFWAWRQTGGARLRWPGRRRLRVLWRQGAPLGLATLLSVAQIKADVLVLGALAAGATVGHYALAQKLGEVLLLVPVVVLDLSFAMLLRSAWPVAVQDTWLFDLASATAQGAALLNALLAPLLVGLFFGADYAAAAPLAQVLGLGAVALALDAARQRWLLRHGLQALAWRVSLLGLAVTLCLLALAVPLGGAAAAAGAMVLAGLLTSALAPWLDVRLRPLAALQWRALWPWHRLWRGRVLSGLRCVRPRRRSAAARRASAVAP